MANTRGFLHGRGVGLVALLLATQPSCGGGGECSVEDPIAGTWFVDLGNWTPGDEVVLETMCTVGDGLDWGNDWSIPLACIVSGTSRSIRIAGTVDADFTASVTAGASVLLTYRREPVLSPVGVQYDEWLSLHMEGAEAPLLYAVNAPTVEPEDGWLAGLDVALVDLGCRPRKDACSIDTPKGLELSWGSGAEAVAHQQQGGLTAGEAFYRVFVFAALEFSYDNVDPCIDSLDPPSVVRAVVALDS